MDQSSITYHLGHYFLGWNTIVFLNPNEVKGFYPNGCPCKQFLIQLNEHTNQVEMTFPC